MPPYCDCISGLSHSLSSWSDTSYFYSSTTLSKRTVLLVAFLSKLHVAVVLFRHHISDILPYLLFYIWPRLYKAVTLSILFEEEGGVQLLTLVM